MNNAQSERVLVFFTPTISDKKEWIEKEEERGWNFGSNSYFAVRADCCTSSQQFSNYGDLENFLKSVNVKFTRLVIWINGWKYAEDNSKADSAKDDFEKIKSHLPDGAEILVAYHGWERFSVTGVMTVQYHSDLDGYQKALLKLASCDSNKFNDFFDQAWNYLKGAPRLPKLKHLNHRIEHILAPLAVDIQGILQVEGSRRLEYAQKVIESYSRRGNHPMLQLLADLVYLLSKNKEMTVTTSLTEEDLPEVRQLSGEFKRMALNEILGPQNDIKCAKEIRNLCGLDDRYNFKDDSSLAQFLKKLDDAIAKRDPAELIRIIKESGKEKERGNEFLDLCRQLHQKLDELERLLPESAEPLREANEEA